MVRRKAVEEMKNDENAMKRNQLIKEAEEDAKQFFRGKHVRSSFVE